MRTNIVEKHSFLEAFLPSGTQGAKAKQYGSTLFAILIDPEDFEISKAEEITRRIPGYTSHILVGGSTATQSQTMLCVQELKKHCDLPIVLFPGHYDQITTEADALLFLTLISGRNPEYLIGQQVKAAPALRKSGLEVIPTGYILINSGLETTVERISKTHSLDPDDVETIVNTALAGQYSGNRLIYLEAGSGAQRPISPEIIAAVSHAIEIPLIVGGGIRTREGVRKAYDAGAQMVVVGTAFENGNFI